MIELKPYRTQSRLGITPANITTVGNYVAQANAIAQNLGAKPTNETLNSVAQIAGVAALIPGIGPVAASVIGLVGAAASLLSTVFGGGPSTADQLRDINAGNTILRDQIRSIDDQTAKINQALQTLQQALQQNGLAGWAEDMIALQVEQSATAPLQQQLANKGRNLQVLIETFNQTIQQTYDAIYGKRTAQKIILYTLLAVGVAGLGYALLSKKTDKQNG